MTQSKKITNTTASNFVSKPLSQNKASRTKRPLKLISGDFSHEISPFLSNTITPTVEEWEYLTSDEPEISFYREKIRKTGKLNEEI
jgi:hypothetical protein